MEPKEFDFSFPRGDTCPVSFTLQDNGGTILEFSGGDELTFTMKKGYRSNDIILQKKYSANDFEITDGNVCFVLQHEDTANLKFGSYVYDIEFRSGDYVRTVALGTITLTNEATWN